MIRLEYGSVPEGAIASAENLVGYVCIRVGQETLTLGDFLTSLWMLLEERNFSSRDPRLWLVNHVIVMKMIDGLLPLILPWPAPKFRRLFTPARWSELSTSQLVPFLTFGRVRVSAVDAVRLGYDVMTGTNLVGTHDPRLRFRCDVLRLAAGRL